MYIDQYTSDEFMDNLEKSRLVILPIGSVEAHGYHLPIGTDIFSPRLFCRMLDQTIGERIWIAPEIPYGQSYDLTVFPGTINIPSQVFADYVYWVGKGLFENGMKKLLILNGHGGNNTALNLAGEMLMKLGLDVMLVNWWLDYSADIISITGGQGHAGEDETSAILYYDSSLVRMDKAERNLSRLKINNLKFKDRGEKLYPNAMSGDAAKATVEQGKRIFKKLTENLIRDIGIFESGDYIQNCPAE